MEKTKDIIKQKSLELFLEKGYDGVSMREIADACGIAVGNLTYYYKKEQLLMDIHDRLLFPFWEGARRDKALDGLSAYFAAEYAFLRYVVDSDALYGLYNQVVNFPRPREIYYSTHCKLCREFAESVDGDSAILHAVTAFCSLSFHMMEQGILKADFDGTAVRIFMSWYVFCSRPIDRAAIDAGITGGKRLRQEVQVDL